jgi:hypothetical protein
MKSQGIPPGIVKRAAQVPQPYALFIYLDCIPYCEIAEYDHKAFNMALDIWKRATLPSLKKSEVSYYLRGKDLTISQTKL